MTGMIAVSPRHHLVRVVAPHFVAGAVVVDGRVTECAPILWRYAVTICQRSARCLVTSLRVKGWTVEITEDPNQ